MFQEQSFEGTAERLLLECFSFMNKCSVTGTQEAYPCFLFFWIPALNIQKWKIPASSWGVETVFYVPWKVNSANNFCGYAWKSWLFLQLLHERKVILKKELIFPGNLNYFFYIFLSPGLITVVTTSLSSITF